MKYRNPTIKEGINVSQRHPFKEFLILTGGALLLILVGSWLVGQFGGNLFRLIPFEKEAALVPDTMLESDAGPELQAYLDQLGTRVATAMELPEGMQVSIHFSAADTFNAFATLGGNVLLFKGLLAQLPHENALTMLLAHEIAHVLHRDPIVSIGQGVAIQTLIGLFFGDANLGALGKAGIYTQLHYGRGMEHAADAAAMAVLQRLYGHINGGQALFEVIQKKRSAASDFQLPAIFSSHPLDAQRLQAIDDSAQRYGWSNDGPITPLPDGFTEWLKTADDEEVSVE